MSEARRVPAEPSLREHAFLCTASSIGPLYPIGRLPYHVVITEKSRILLGFSGTVQGWQAAFQARPDLSCYANTQAYYL